MALQITIGGVDRTSLIDWSSVNVRQVLTKSSDEMTFNIKKYGTKTYTPAMNDEVVFTHDGTRVFAGYIVQKVDDVEGLGQYQKLIVKDYSFAFENQLITKTYSNTTVNAIIADLVSNYAPAGFTVTNVNAPATITKIVFNYISISQCLKQLAKGLSNYDWYIDYNKNLYFFSIGTVVAPFNLTDTSANYVYSSLEVVTDISQLANDVTIRGGKVAATQTRTEYWSGDGTRYNFPLGNDFSATPVVTVGGVSKTVGLDGVDADASFNCMWNQSSQLLRFTSGNTPIAGTNNVAITGYPQFPLIYRKANQSSIALYGSRPKFIKEITIQDINTASQRADAELQAYSSPTSSGHFITYVDGLFVGQYINITSVIRNVNVNFKIQSVGITCRTPNDLQYNIEVQTGGSTTINDILTQLLISDPAASIDASSNDTIQRISLFAESMTITDAVQTPTTSTGPYVYDTAKYNLSTWG